MLRATIRKVVSQDDTQGNQGVKDTDNQMHQGGTRGGTQGGTQDGTQDGTQGGTQELSDKIYGKIKDNPNITMDELAVSLNVGRRTIARHLKQMSDRVHYVGSGYSGHWEVIPSESKD